jgi:predicted nucleotidyltransferase component of viral defense system
MIPKSYLTEWTHIVPWQEERQVEQDLIITTALLKLYSNPTLQSSLAFRGGTALNKLFFQQPSRYSEDIDLVQIVGEPIGPTTKLIRGALDSFLGKPSKELSFGRITFTYRFIGEDGRPLKLKIEINTREHFSILGFLDKPFSSSSSFHPGETIIRTYKIEELLGTKLRALYQRRKGRDLYDLYISLTTMPLLDLDALVHCFIYYLKHENRSISRAEFINNLEAKLSNKEFRIDTMPLLPPQATFDPDKAYEYVRTYLIEKL